MKDSQLSYYGVQQMEKRLISLIKEYGQLQWEIGLNNENIHPEDAKKADEILKEIIDIIES